MSRVLVAGETLVDFVPDRPGPLAEVDGFRRRAGGAPANVAVGLARLGEPAPLLTRLGRDPFGDFLAATLADRGVPDRFVQRDPDRKTALAFVTHDAGGDRSFTFYRDDTADLHVDGTAVTDDALDALSTVAVGGVMLAADPARSTTFDLVARARERGCTVVFDPNRRPELWPAGDYVPVVERMVGLADVVKATPGDAAGTAFAADTPGGVAAALLDAGPHTALVTRGDAGALGRATAAAPWGPADCAHPGFDVAAVDATGAGDAFLAGALAALARERSLADAVTYGSAVAALATTGAGATAALPDRAAVTDFLRERGAGAI